MPYRSYDPRITIRETIGTSRLREFDFDDDEYWILEVDDDRGDTVEVPLYLSEEVKSGSLKEMPFIDMHLAHVSYEPQGIAAESRKKECYIDIGVWYTDTDNIDRHAFGQSILDEIIRNIRNNQCQFDNIDFINISDVRLMREELAHQVVYHYVVTCYCIRYDTIP